MALTERTIVDPDRLRDELDLVLTQGYAVDDEEIAPGLRCLAVPLRNGDGAVIAAISVSQALSSPLRMDDTELLGELRETAAVIENDAFARA